MKFTDLFIERPVLSVVVSLLILVLGARAIFGLPVSQFPQTENAVVTISTAYYGADAATIAGFITQPLEQAIAQAQGIDYLSSSSITGSSVITATLRLNYDSSRALTEINTQVSSVRNQLPPQAQQPVISVAGRPDHRRDVPRLLQRHHPRQQRHRLPEPRGEAKARIHRRGAAAEMLGARQFALRAWLDPARMAAHGVAADDVYNALAANNYLTAVGEHQGPDGDRQPGREHRPALASMSSAAWW